jgi:hypothetical protein
MCSPKTVWFQYFFSFWSIKPALSLRYITLERETHPRNYWHRQHLQSDRNTCPRPEVLSLCHMSRWRQPPRLHASDLLPYKKRPFPAHSSPIVTIKLVQKYCDVAYIVLQHDFINKPSRTLLGDLWSHIWDRWSVLQVSTIKARCSNR